MLALEYVSCFAVVEGLLRRFPVDQGEVLAIVFGMAADAVLVGAGRADDCSMEAAPQRKPARNIGMTLQAPKDP